MQAYVLNIDEGRRGLFLDHVGDYFAEPVQKFSHPKSAPLLVFISATDNKVTHLASGRPGSNAGTGLRRLNLENIHELTTPVEFAALVRLAPKKVRRHVIDRLRFGGTIPKATLQSIVDGLIELDPSLEGMLARYSAKRENAIAELTSEEISSFALQKEAVSTALHFAGIDRKPLTEWTPGEGRKRSFLDGLPQAYVREDLMIIHDMAHVPGLRKIGSSVTGTASFENESVRLDLILANRTRLEEQTGADLIYYNATYESFVMVQYKAMEKEAERAVFRLPNAKLAEEIARMDGLMAEFGKIAPPTERNGYRLLGNPFFIKICPRIILKPDEADLTPGMYFSLDHWKILETDPGLKGPKGGQLISYENVGRRLNNGDFAGLVQNAWVGTTPQQSAMLEPIIESILTEGRAVVIAVKNQKDGPRFEETGEFF